MAMRKCRECGGDVSTSAKFCPHCGSKRFRRNKLIDWIASAALIAVVLYFIFQVQQT